MSVSLRLRFLTADKFRPTSIEYFEHIHGDIDTAIRCIHSSMDTFAVLISTLGRTQFDPRLGPIEVDRAVFSFREAAVTAWGAQYFTCPNFLNLTQYSDTLSFYGAPAFISTTRLGM